MKKNELAQKVKQLIYDGIKLDSTRSGKFEPVIHVSDLYDGCPRKFVLAYKNGIKLNVERKIPNGLKVTFRIGNKLEEAIVEALKGYLHGYIKSAAGMWKYTAPLLKYKAGKFEITGHPDIIIELPNVGKVILEIKTIDKDAFDELQEPIFKHEYQLLTYLYLSKKLRLGCLNTGLIVYVAKGYKQDPLKVFPVTLTKSHREQMEEFISKVGQKNIPARVCKTELNPLARNCEIKEVCFEHGKKE